MHTTKLVPTTRPSCVSQSRTFAVIRGWTTFNGSAGEATWRSALRLSRRWGG